MLKNIIKNLNYSIEKCAHTTVGIKSYDKNIVSNYTWNSSPQNPFKDLNLNRIYLVVHGNAQIYLQNSVLDLNEGYIYLIPSNSIIATKCTSFMEHYYIHFNLEYNYNNLFNLIHFTNKIEAVENHVNYFRTIENFYSSTNIKDIFFTQGSFQCLLASFFDNATLKNPNILKFNKVIEYIDNNYKKKLMIRELAEIMNLNNTYFSNCFTQTFNLTVSNYICNKRITEAKRLLINFDLPINEIAFQCGFEDPLYFSKIFSKTVKMSPTQYRKSMLQHLNEN